MTTNQANRDQQLRDMRLSTGDFPGYAFPGGYEIHYLTEDNGILCHECANRRNGSEAYIGTDPSGELGSDPQWHIVGHDCHWEGPALTCDHCQREIAGVYGDPDDDDDDDDDSTRPTAIRATCSPSTALPATRRVVPKLGRVKRWPASNAGATSCPKFAGNAPAMIA